MGSDTIVTFAQWLRCGREPGVRHDRNTNKRKLPTGRVGFRGLFGCCFDHIVRALARRWRLPSRSAAAPNADTGQAWFAKPFDISGRSAGYTFSELSETKKDQRPITPNDLVNAGGSCPAPATPLPPLRRSGASRRAAAWRP